MLGQMRGKTILLWFADHAPPEDAQVYNGLGRDPLFVTRMMIDQLAPFVTKVVTVVTSDAACDEGTDGMVFNPLEAHAAKILPGALAHEEAAAALTQTLSGMV